MVDISTGGDYALVTGGMGNAGFLFEALGGQLGIGNPFKGCAVNPSGRPENSFWKFEEAADGSVYHLVYKDEDCMEAVWKAPSTRTSRRHQ